MNNTKVLLDLTKMNYSDAAACENNNLIHQSKMAQIMSIWDGLYKKALGALDYSNEQNQEIHRHHNAISIFASRGAGKTTFLLSVLTRIKNEYENVLCLKPLDPSLIEMKQHPFINIIAGIQELVEQKYDKEERYDTRREEFEYKKEFDNNYKKMLRALPFIDGVGKKGVYEEWDDEEFISILGMEKAEASNNLEKSFHDYVRMALKLLKKKCLVISFDDIDTEFKRGYEILEVIRKYLTSAQIVTIITGDLELYGKLVRKASWKCFDLAFLRKEVQYGKRKKEEFSLMVDQLENQYLVKILKPENRVLLKTIREYLEEENYSLEVLFSSQREMEIDECYSLIIELLGLEKNNLKVSEEIIRFLEGLSLRVQIRILTLLNNLLIAQGRYDKRKMLAKPELSTGLLDIFWNDINQKSHNAKALIKAGPIYTIDMLNFLVNTNALYIGANFLPETNDEILNKALFAIGARFNELVNRNHFLIFDYWMRISYVRAVSEKMGGKKDNEILNNFLGFTLLDADAGLNKSVGLAHAFCNSVLNNSFNDEIDVLPGTIFIGNKSPLQLLEYNYILSLLPMLGTMDAMKKESVFVLAKEGLMFLRENPLIMALILFMSSVNLVASAFDAVLPGYVLPNPKGGTSVLGIVTSCSGIAMIVGSLAVSVLPKPKNRVKIIYLTMLFSLGTENFLLAFSREPLLWCIGQMIGWILVPIMSANLDVVLRTTIPVELQGRVYACRNTLQFFTIPIGLFIGGFMVDNVCEPFMRVYGNLSVLKMLFGSGKGSGAALMMLILGVSGSLLCFTTGKKLKKYQYNEE